MYILQIIMHKGAFTLETTLLRDVFLCFHMTLLFGATYANDRALTRQVSNKRAFCQNLLKQSYGNNIHAFFFFFFFFLFLLVRIC